MQINRSIRISIKEHIKSALESFGYNVYGEDDLPSRNPGSILSTPYLFLVDVNIEPTVADLPLVIVNVNPISKRVSELGRQARSATVEVYVYGKTRGDRDDIASYLQDYVSTQGVGNKIVVRDYGTSGNPVVSEGFVMSGVLAWSVTNIREWERIEASASNLSVVQFEIEFRN